MDQLFAIIQRVEAGESVRQILGDTTRASKPPAAANLPTRNQFRRDIQKHPALNDRYKAAVAKWSAPHARSLMHFDEIERLIIAGGAINDILDHSPPTFPDYHSLWKFLKARPEYAARYRAAFRIREAGPNARGIAPKYTDAELRQAAAELAATSTRYVSITRVAKNAPHARTLMKARARGGDLCALIESAMLTRITRLRIMDGPIFKPLTPGLVVPRRKAVRRIYEKYVLKRSLSQNEIYAAVDAAVPRYFAPYDRDDIIAQTVLEVIEDGIELRMIASVAREIITDHFNTMRLSSKTRSLDAPVFADSHLNFGDTISNGW